MTETNINPEERGNETLETIRRILAGYATQAQQRGQSLRNEGHDEAADMESEYQTAIDRALSRQRNGDASGLMGLLMSFFSRRFSNPSLVDPGDAHALFMSLGRRTYPQLQMVRASDVIRLHQQVLGTTASPEETNTPQKTLDWISSAILSIENNAYPWDSVSQVGKLLFALYIEKAALERELGQRGTSVDDVTRAARSKVGQTIETPEMRCGKLLQKNMVPKAKDLKCKLFSLVQVTKKDRDPSMSVFKEDIKWIVEEIFGLPNGQGWNLAASSIDSPLKLGVVNLLERINRADAATVQGRPISDGVKVRRCCDGIIYYLGNEFGMVEWQPSVGETFNGKRMTAGKIVDTKNQAQDRTIESISAPGLTYDPALAALIDQKISTESPANRDKYSELKLHTIDAKVSVYRYVA